MVRIVTDTSEIPYNVNYKGHRFSRLSRGGEFRTRREAEQLARNARDWGPNVAIIRVYKTKNYGFVWYVVYSRPRGK